jgi:CheY-like chemotaxis protein
VPPRLLLINNSDDLTLKFLSVLAGTSYQLSVRGLNNTTVQEVCSIAPDIIILDRESDGNRVNWDLLRLLKANRKTKAIPVIICTTGVRQAGEIAEFLAAKFVAVLHKPFDENELLRTVKSQLNAYEIATPSLRHSSRTLNNYINVRLS